MRRKLLLGNWKMNKTVTEAKEFALQAKELGKLAKANKIDMGICVPAIDLEPVKKILKKSLIVGAENVHYLEKGAYTAFRTGGRTCQNVGGGRQRVQCHT